MGRRHPSAGRSTGPWCRDDPLLHVLVDEFGPEDHDGPDDRIGNQSDDEFHDISLLRRALGRPRRRRLEATLKHDHSKWNWADRSTMSFSGAVPPGPGFRVPPIGPAKGRTPP